MSFKFASGFGWQASRSAMPPPLPARRRKRSLVRRQNLSLTSNLWDFYIVHERSSAQAVTRKTLSEAGAYGAWKRWNRERAIVELLPMVLRVAREVRWMFSPTIDIRDLAQAGNVGLVKAANAYRPSRASQAGFEAYAYFRVRGAIIDSQKRRAYREERNVSLQAIAQANDGWLPPALDTDRTASAYDQAEREQIHRVLQNAIRALPTLERSVLRGQLAGQPLAVTARQVGRSVTWTRAKLAEARTMVGISVRGE